MLDAIAQAVERRGRSPSSADAIERHAELLKTVRDKILAQLSPRERSMFPDYLREEAVRSPT